ncbi:MAG: ferredoxin Fer [Halobacteriaceae archaeon]
MASPFEVLGVDPDADEATVVAAYRERIKEVHPDHGGSASEFRAVRRAYERIQAGVAEADPDREHGRDRPESPRQPECEVAYLNYEVLEDYGWSLGDADLFARAGDADLPPRDYGEFVVTPEESLLEAAERCGYAWPYACRGGACANCAVAVVSGELAQPVDHILPPELIARGIRLSCNGRPLTDELEVVFNLKHLPALDEFRLPPGPFEQAYPDGTA